MISVIIPTYKSPEALDLCLRSALEGQDKDTNQIIVVVDGHYNLNKEVLDKYGDKVDKLILEENVGLCRGTNLGVYNAKHEHILIVNDDNVFPKHWDSNLLLEWGPGDVVTPNQIEPYSSIFPQFHIKDLGRTIKDFKLEEFQKYSSMLPKSKRDNTGSTLPIFMSKTDYLRVGGWDENYELGLVADWDFFLKCQLSGLNLVRIYDVYFYHFVSLSTNTTEEQKQNRQRAEIGAHNYAKYKWGTNIKHNPTNNLKYL
tara:strand:- start:57 stop:827 length:771 start_codon:yes stop_codon:yes gene_type:complete